MPVVILSKIASFEYFMFTEIKKNMVPNFKYIWFIKTKQIYIRTRNDKMPHNESHLFVIVL